MSITGLFLGTASSLANGGPAGLLLGYVIVSTVCLSSMCFEDRLRQCADSEAAMLSLGELITFL